MSTDKGMHQPGVDRFYARPEEIDARTDEIAAANGQQGLLTLISKKELEGGMVEVTCIAFLTQHPEEAAQKAKELGLKRQDLAQIKAPAEGTAPADMDF